MRYLLPLFRFTIVRAKIHPFFREFQLCAKTLFGHSEHYQEKCNAPGSISTAILPIFVLQTEPFLFVLLTSPEKLVQKFFLHVIDRGHGYCRK